MRSWCSEWVRTRRERGVGTVMGIGWGEAVALLILGLIIVGPDRLPEVSAQVVRAIRSVRAYADGAKQEINATVAPHLQQWNELAALPKDLQGHLTAGWQEVIGGDELQGHAPLTRATPLYLDAT